VVVQVGEKTAATTTSSDPNSVLDSFQIKSKSLTISPLNRELSDVISVKLLVSDIIISVIDLSGQGI
jgi:hypothetical protein